MLSAGLWLAACSAAGGATATLAPTQPLVLYHTATAIPTTTLAEIAATAVLPTATPQVYTVVAGDTMFAIAARNEISVQGLLAANPDVDPLLLFPGTELVIPAAGAVLVTALPSPTPVAARLADVECYASALGELWCFLLVNNDNDFPLENLIGTVQLLSPEGEVLASLEAVPPMNVLLPGQSLPLVAYRSAPPVGWSAVRGQLLSAYAVSADDEAYIGVEIVGRNIEVGDTGLSAHVTGQLQIAAGQSASQLWVLAVAYDVDGNAVGVRRWEGNGETDFEIWVYSLGPEIALVELLAEARP